MNGEYALLSIVQMPAGVPVAAVAIDNATNGGLLAAQILGAGDDKLRQRITEYKNDLKDLVMEKVAKLEKNT